MSLEKLLPEFPHVEIERVNVIENPDAARNRGVRRYPALAHEDELLQKLFLTRRRIRRFLKDIGAGTP